MKKVVLFCLVIILSIVWLHGGTGKCTDFSVTVPRGGSMQTIENALVDQGCIRSALLFSLYTRIFNPQIKEGTYTLPDSKTLLEYVFVFTDTTYRSVIRFTVPEGFTNMQIAERCAALLPNCDVQKFVEKTKSDQGYLFPETYLFGGSENEDVVIALMKKEFRENIDPLFEQYPSPFSREDVINMAAILEKEANTEVDMKMIADILMRRMKIGMPLQVDATLFYERGQASKDLSIADLRKDSPYNTYTNLGLPPGPIGNPGRVAIQAVLTPISNAYFYYLTGRDGKMYYAVTHDEHVRNKRLYLR